MDGRTRTAFAFVIVAQTAHSIEEYVYRLFDVFGPARFVSGLLSTNLRVGFALANGAIVLFGGWCYIARVRLSHPSARRYAWFWTCLELANGVGHVILAAAQGAYFPGVGTAPLLIGTSSYLGVGLMKSSHQS